MIYPLSMREEFRAPAEQNTSEVCSESDSLLEVSTIECRAAEVGFPHISSCEIGSSVSAIEINVKYTELLNLK